jgi:hypothetical protein
MNRHTPLAIVVLAACGLVVWAFRAGVVRQPRPGLGRDVSVVVHVVADDAEVGSGKRNQPGAKGYGSISGQAVLVGEIPILPALVRAGENRMKPEDRATCAREGIPDESLLVDEATRGIANVFVYLPQATRGVHPGLEKSADRNVMCEIKGCQFVPRALFARTDQQVVVRAKDHIPHTAHDRPLRTVRFQQVIKPLNDCAGMTFAYTRSEPKPFPVVCDLHTWMRSHWLILDHPYAAITDAQGKFTIADLPAGAYEFRIWHETAGEMEQSLKVAVKADQTTNVGEIRVPVDRFAEDARRRK